MWTSLIATSIFLFGTLGGGNVLDDEGSIGKGLDVGAGVGVAVGERLDLEVALERIAHDRPTDFLSWDGAALRTMGRARYYFGDRAGPVVAFVAGGAGVMRSTGTVTERRTTGPRSDPGVIESVRDWSYTGPAWEAGGGIDVRAGRFFVRPEAYFTVGQLDRGDRLGVPEAPLTMLRGVVTAGFRF